MPPSERQLHGNEVAITLIDVANGPDVGMPQSGRGMRFTLEATASTCVPFLVLSGCLPKPLQRLVREGGSGSVAIEHT
jgi:hypothetical protein